MKKNIFLIVAAICLLSFFANVFWNSKAPACFDADEAAFGYNAYSLLKTGKDEYGSPFPLRLKSFGDYKMPLYSYVSMPFIALFGLNETGARAANHLVALLFPLVVFLLTKELFDSRVGLFAAFLTAISVGLHLIGRQTHEAYLAAFLITTALYFFIKTCKKFQMKHFLWFLFFLFLSLFTYQSSRLYAVFFLIAGAVYLFRPLSKKATLLLIFIGVIGIFAITDFVYKPTRVQNLILFSNKGFSIKLDELKTEGGIKPLYNDLFQGIKDATFAHLSYFSPQFLVIKGDDNARFGYNGMSLVTPVEYIFIFVGLYFLFKNKEKWRYLLIALWLISPLTSSLSWADMSITRSLFFLVPTLILSAYGMNHFLFPWQGQKSKLLLAGGLGLLFFFFALVNWDFYLFHYSKRIVVERAWQCGYKDLASYIKDNYQKFDKFYITKKHGEPYIFLLFYLKYPPENYQPQARLTSPDQYGFGQIERFDKFEFNFKSPKDLPPGTVTIGYPDDFTGIGMDDSNVKKINYRTEQIFWIYEKAK